MAVITIGGVSKEYAVGTTFEQIAQEYQEQYNNTIALITENGKIRELHKKVIKDAEVNFITLSDPIGHKTYERSAIMLFVKAVHDVMGKDVSVKVDFAIGKGLYCAILSDQKVNDETVKQINDRMNEMVAADIPIVK